MVDSLFVPSNVQNYTLVLQMKGGRSKPLSGDSASTIYDTTGGHLVFVVPGESIVTKKLGDSGGSAGPSQMRQFRIVVKEAS